MARAKGTTLKEIANTLTREQMSDVVQDLRQHIKRWRRITRPQMQRVDGSALRDAYIGNCTGFGCIKTGHNEEEWLKNLTPAMRKGMLWDNHTSKVLLVIGKRPALFVKSALVLNIQRLF